MAGYITVHGDGVVTGSNGSDITDSVKGSNFKNWKPAIDQDQDGHFHPDGDKLSKRDQPGYSIIIPHGHAMGLEHAGGKDFVVHTTNGDVNLHLDLHEVNNRDIVLEKVGHDEYKVVVGPVEDGRHNNHGGHHHGDGHGHNNDGGQLCIRLGEHGNNSDIEVGACVNSPIDIDINLHKIKGIRSALEGVKFGFNEGAEAPSDDPSTLVASATTDVTGVAMGDNPELQALENKAKLNTSPGATA